MPKKSKSTVFVCSSCGEEFIQWQGRCTNCGEWNTLKEYSIPSASAHGTNRSESANPIRLVDVAEKETSRTSTGFSEFDRVLGGGCVPGGVILLGGDPGIGKSTLLLQVVEKMAASGRENVLYVSGEESAEQIKLRASRLGVTTDQIYLLPTTSISQVEAAVESLQPKLLVIDSIQTMYDDRFPSTPGSLVQVRESALRLQQQAKQKRVATVLVGHITKEGTVAGPRTLEHLVDVVLYLEGDSERDLRILRGVKNRFGSVNEAGLFTMGQDGMVEVTNPSQFLLEERVGAPGTVLTAILEGTRPMLIEVQALTVPTTFGNPRRTGSGYDVNRLNLLLAVLQRRAGANLSQHDVFVNIVGGLKVKDPAIDLAVCAAVVSALHDVPVAERVCVMGEVGLAGEIRRAWQQDRREKMVRDLGYQVPTFKKDIRDALTSVVGLRKKARVA